MLGTFFTLGWVAERCPALISRIAAAGHEIASHGFMHGRVDRQSPEDFRADIDRARKLLEDTAGVPVAGYRAPTFSIGKATPWAADIPAGNRPPLQLQRLSHPPRPLRRP